MSTDYVRAFDGRILGRVETDNNGNKITRDFYGKIISRYDSTMNVTRNFGGRVVARGDASTSMLVDKR